MSDNSKSSKQKFDVYPSIKGGVQAIQRQIEVTKYYTIKDFYKPSLVKDALNDLELSDNIKVPTAQGNILQINPKELQSKLNKDIELLKGFFDKQLNKPLAVTSSMVVNDAGLKKLERYFTHRVIQPNEWEADSMTISKDLGGAKVFKEVRPEPVKVPIEGYLVNDKVGLLGQVKALKPTEYSEHKSYEIMTSPEGNTIEGLRDYMQDLTELANACGIGQDSGAIMQIGNVVVLQVHLEILGILGQVLGVILERNKPKGGALYTNIKDKDLDATPLPAVTAYQVSLEEINKDPEVVKLLTEVRRSKDEQGLPIQIQQSFLDLVVSENKDTKIAKPDEGLTGLGFAEWVTLDDIQKLLKQAGAYALKPALRYLHDNPQGGDVTLQDLMLYDGKLKSEYNKRKSIAITNKKQFSNSLRLQLQFKYEIPVKSRNRETKLYYITLIEGEPVLDTETGLITRIDNLRYGKDLSVHKLLGVIDHKNADFLASPEARLLNDKIQAGLILGKQQKKTVKGEPLVIKADKLLSGIVQSDKNPTVYYKWLTKQLDELVKLDSITKWHTKAGGNEIKGRDKDTRELYIYPSKLAQSNYRTVEMYKNDKEADNKIQSYRRKELNKLCKQYLHDDNEVARELGIEVEALQKLLAKVEPIEQDLYDKIRELIT